MRLLRSSGLVLVAATLVAGCDGVWPGGGIVGAGPRGADMAREYDATWVYSASIPALRRYESGGCYGEMEIDQGSGDRFGGRFTIPADRTCIPTRSGTLSGRMAPDGDFHMQLRLPDGSRGVFEEYPNCIRVRSDEYISGELWDGYLRGNAEALFTCNMLGFGWTDIHLRVTLNAQPVGF